MAGAIRTIVFLMSTLSHLLIGSHYLFNTHADCFKDFMSFQTFRSGCINFNTPFKLEFYHACGAFSFVIASYFISKIYKRELSRFTFELAGLLHAFYAFLSLTAEIRQQTNQTFFLSFFMVNVVAVLLLNIELFSKSNTAKDETLAEDEDVTDDDDQSYHPPANESSSTSSFEDDEQKDSSE